MPNAFGQMQDGMGLSHLPAIASAKPVRSCMGGSGRGMQTAPVQAKGSLPRIGGSWSLLLLFLVKGWPRGVGDSPFILVFNCYKSRL